MTNNNTTEKNFWNELPQECLDCTYWKKSTFRCEKCKSTNWSLKRIWVIPRAVNPENPGRVEILIYADICPFDDGDSMTREELEHKLRREINAIVGWIDGGGWLEDIDHEWTLTDEGEYSWTHTCEPFITTKDDIDWDYDVEVVEGNTHHTGINRGRCTYCHKRYEVHWRGVAPGSPDDSNPIEHIELDGIVEVR